MVSLPWKKWAQAKSAQDSPEVSSAPAGDTVAPYEPPSAFLEDETDSVDTADRKQQGVVVAEAAREVAGWKLYLAFLGLALASYVNSLDNGTGYAYLTAATDQFGQYGLYPSIQVIQQVCIAVFKFPVAKLSDCFGRAQGYIFSVLLYILGLIVLAACPGFTAIVVGTVFYAFGSTGLQIMQQIVLADITPTKWRGAAIGLLSAPYIINFAVSPRVVGQLAPFGTTSEDWRWGFGMFTILLPVATAPVIFSLALSQREAKKQGLVAPHPYRRMPVLRAIKSFFFDIDVPALVLIAAGFVLILLALQLSALTASRWSAAHIITMLVVGGVCLVGLVLYEWLLAPKPIIPRAFLLNKNVALPAFFIGWFDFAAFYLSWTPAYTWVFITYNYNASDATYFSNTQSLCLTVFGIAAGFLALATKRNKWVLTAGSCIRLLGLGLMVRYRDAMSTTFQIVICQVLQGLGGGLMGVSLQVQAQISVRHQLVAMVTAFVLLFTEIGGACGTAVLGALQLHVLQPRLAQELSPLGVSAAEITSAFGSPLGIAWPLGDPRRDAVIRAWSHYMHIVLIVALVLSAVPILASLLVTNFKLGNTQNCVSDELNLNGTEPARPQVHDEETHTPSHSHSDEKH
ncbi:MFS general substrate transporter [Ceraceosorus guamensis]|uniref:MFS general substrate transporter n=1 Tax=Ceraceosorus guamensis TaxID=1522189 RepID=A0A316W5Q8_9BASI|nr:MFS general substrate transporter [Ceraceosorus guamensis]PWN44994.1 MFS general substrate transporter [Ceraceosorus guamensis]